MLDAIKTFIVIILVSFVIGVVLVVAGLYFQIPPVVNIALHTEKGREMSTELSSKIVQEFYVGGREITCDSIDAQWGGKLKVKISWHGSLNEYATYWVEGEITPPTEESRGRWRPTSASQSLRDLFPHALDERIIENK